MTIEQALFRLHEGLPRHAPGSESTTLKALRRIGRLSRKARIIDVGCGNGASTCVLAKRLKKPIVAVDAHRPYLDELADSLKAEGLSELVEILHADFASLGEGLGKFDLLWAEGAAYVLGFEQALLTWRPLLSGRGRAAVSELSYLVDLPSEQAKEYWSSVYPGITTIVGNCAAAERTGYSVIDTLVFSSKATKAYYGPIKGRIAELRGQGELSPELCAVIAEMEREIEIYERYSEEVGYVFYLLEKQGGEEASEEDMSAELFGLDSETEEDEEEPRSERVRTRAVPRSFAGVSTRAFDVGVAPTNAMTHQKLEQQVFELISELGLARACQVLEQVERRVDAVVKSGR